MKIIRAKNYEDLSLKAADLISAQINLIPNSVLGLATGSSPIGIYQKLVEAHQQGMIDFSSVTTINLDEYRGLERTHEQSYWHFMQKNLFCHINIKEKNTFIPDGSNCDSEKVCKAYDDIIESVGGIDLQLLGIGLNGHIGFNEPANWFEPDTHCVDLTENTINANKRFFNNKNEVPKQAYTMGIRPIMQAKTVIMIANGKNKAEIIKKAFTQKITPAVPASILQLHKNFILIADEEALCYMESPRK